MNKISMRSMSKWLGSRRRRQRAARWMMPLVGAIALAPLVPTLTSGERSVVSVGATTRTVSAVRNTCETARGALWRAYLVQMKPDARLTPGARSEFLGLLDDLADTPGVPKTAPAQRWIESWRGYMLYGNAVPKTAALRPGTVALKGYVAEHC